MKSIGIFEAKTKFSEICERVAETKEPIMVTKRGKPLVRIDPVGTSRMSVWERREKYLTKNEQGTIDDEEEFEIPPRSRAMTEYTIED